MGTRFDGLGNLLDEYSSEWVMGGARCLYIRLAIILSLASTQTKRDGRKGKRGVGGNSTGATHERGGIGPHAPGTGHR